MRGNYGGKNIIKNLTHMPLYECVKIKCNKFCRAFSSYFKCSDHPVNISNNYKVPALLCIKMVHRTVELKLSYNLFRYLTFTEHLLSA